VAVAENSTAPAHDFIASIHGVGFSTINEQVIFLTVHLRHHNRPDMRVAEPHSVHPSRQGPGVQLCRFVQRLPNPKWLALIQNRAIR
jgi:hypothetical protein